MTWPSSELVKAGSSQVYKIDKTTFIARVPCKALLLLTGVDTMTDNLCFFPGYWENTNQSEILISFL